MGHLRILYQPVSGQLQEGRWTTLFYSQSINYGEREKGRRARPRNGVLLRTRSAVPTASPRSLKKSSGSDYSPDGCVGLSESKEEVTVVIAIYSFSTRDFWGGPLEFPLQLSTKFGQANLTACDPLPPVGRFQCSRTLGLRRSILKTPLRSRDKGIGSVSIAYAFATIRTIR